MYPIVPSSVKIWVKRPSHNKIILYRYVCSLKTTKISIKSIFVQAHHADGNCGTIQNTVRPDTKLFPVNYKIKNK
jgi:hypothetical protein